MIKIDNLIKSYKTQKVLDIPALQIESNELIALVGNNGAGKSTLFKLMLDLIASSTGSVSINDIDVTQSEEWKNYTTAYLDNSFLLEYLTPSEYFDMIAVMAKLSKEELATELEKYKGYLGEDNLSNKKYIRNLSAGNQQKVGIVGAMLSKPQVLILDEPFNYLDPTSQERTKKLLKEYQTVNKAIVLVSSHNLEHVLTICTRVLLLENGIIKKDLTGDVAALTNEVHEYFNTDEEDEIAKVTIPPLPLENNED